MKIHNISDVDVYLNQPVVNDNRFQIINTQFPLEIPRNGFNTINFRYRPTDTNFIQLDLELSGYPCGVSTTAQLYGDAVDVVATLKIPDISAKSGQIIAIPIYLIDTVLRTKHFLYQLFSHTVLSLFFPESSSAAVKYLFAKTV